MFLLHLISLGLQLFSGFKYVPFTFTAYSVLNPDRHITGIKEKKIMTQYALYIFGGAALIVGINIISTLVVSEFKLSGYYKKSTLLTYKFINIYVCDKHSVLFSNCLQICFCTKR